MDLIDELAGPTGIAHRGGPGGAGVADRRLRVGAVRDGARQQRHERVDLAVVADLDTTIQGVQLAITAYTLVMAALMLAGAKLGDILGRDRTFAIGLGSTGWARSRRR